MPADGNPPDPRLDSEMAAAIRLALALTTRLQTIRRLIEIEKMTASDVVRAQYSDIVLRLAQLL